MTWIMYESCFWKSNIENAETVATYGIVSLQAPDPDILFKSLRLTWISRLLIPDDTTIESWKSIPSHFFKYGGLNFLLRCNYDFKFLEKSGISIFL